MRSSPLFGVKSHSGFGVTRTNSLRKPMSCHSLFMTDSLIAESRAGSTFTDVALVLYASLERRLQLLGSYKGRMVSRSMGPLLQWRLKS
jgi:hypothetical protein